MPYDDIDTTANPGSTARTAPRRRPAEWDLCQPDAQCAQKHCSGGFVAAARCCGGSNAQCDDQDPCTDDICNPDSNAAIIQHRTMWNAKLRWPDSSNPNLRKWTCNQPSTQCTALDDPCQAPTCDPTTGCGLQTPEAVRMCRGGLHWL